MQLALQFDPSPALRRLWIPLLTGWATQFGLWRGTAPGVLCLVGGYAGVSVEEEDAALCKSFGCCKDDHDDAECHSTRLCTCGQYPHEPACGMPAATWCVHCAEGVSNFCRSRCENRACPKGLPNAAVLRAMMKGPSHDH